MAAFSRFLHAATGVGAASLDQVQIPLAELFLWVQVLHSFDVTNGEDGATPGSQQLAMDAAGALYGTAEQGGAHNMGIVFKVAPPTGAGRKKD